MHRLYKFSLLAALCFGVLTSGATAQENPFGEQEHEFSKIGAGTGTFLNMPVGARALSLGSGFAGVADDPSALYWNPAGIMQVEGASGSYSYTSLFAGMSHNFASATFPVGEGYKVGLSAIAFSSGEIEETTMFQQEGTGARYTATDLAFGLSFAGQLTDQFAFGVTGKFVNLGIANVSANGVAFDVGTMYRPGLLGLRIGFSVSNLSAPLKYTGSDLTHRGQVDPVTGNQAADVQLEAIEASLPLIFRAGVSSNVLEGDDMNQLLLSTEFSTSSAAPEHVAVGAEYVWNNLVAARLGVQVGSPDAYNITGGVGLKYETGSFYGTLDYGIKPHQTLGLINQITASVRFQ
jgi:hypothetical protein